MKIEEEKLLMTMIELGEDKDYFYWKKEDYLDIAEQAIKQGEAIVSDDWDKVKYGKAEIFKDEWRIVRPYIEKLGYSVVYKHSNYSRNKTYKIEKGEYL